MDLTVTALVLLSATLHPLWNLMLKGSPHPETVFFTVLGMTIVLGFCHALAMGDALTSVVSVWPIVALSGVSVGLHGFMLVLSLRRGDLSVYYPIIRSAPLGVVVIGFLFLDQRFPPILLLGIALVLVSAFCLQSRPGTRLLSDPLTLAFATIAMLTSAVYSIADAVAVQYVPAEVVFFWQCTIALPIYVALVLARQRLLGGPGAAALARSWRNRLWQHLVAGSLAYVSYLLILWAYSLGGEVAAVTSVRQASIPLSVLGAALILKEPALRQRLLWASVLVAGVLIVVRTA